MAESVLNPVTFMSRDFVDVCRGTKIVQLEKSIQKVFTVKTSDTIAEAFTLLIQNYILSAPVFDVEQNKYNAFLHMLDILAYIISALDEPSIASGKMGIEEVKSCTRFKKETVKDVLQVSRKNAWIMMNELDSLYETIAMFAKNNLREVAVVNAKGEFVSIITQSRLIQWLSNRSSSEMGQFVSMTIGDFKLGYKKVHCMHQSRRVIDVFLQMNYLGISGMAIVNNENRVIGNISVSDLKDIGGNAEKFMILWTDAATFIKSREYGAKVPRLVYVLHNTAIKKVIGELHTHNIHRVYIVEEHNVYPMGVISCTDILKFFGNALLGYFTVTSPYIGAIKEQTKA